MAGTITSEELKRRVLANFNTLAARYEGLRFVQIYARRLIELTTLPAGARVLDVATGTGLVARVAAQIVGPTGKVIGVDFSPEMVAHAQQTLAETGLTQIEFRQGDAEQLDFPDQSFDVVLCSSSLFFVPDMLKALREFRRVLVPGGGVGFSSFGPTFLHPLQDLWAARLQQYGIGYSVPATLRLADPAACQALLDEAGFTRVTVRSENLGYTLNSAEWWGEIMAGLGGVPLSRFSPAQQEQIKAEHLAEVDALAGSEGIWVDLPAHFSFGWRGVSD